MNDLLIHELGARRVHWLYDDPSGVAEAPARIAGRPARTAGEIRLRRGFRHLAAKPKAA